MTEGVSFGFGQSEKRLTLDTQSLQRAYSDSQLRTNNSAHKSYVSDGQSSERTIDYEKKCIALED